MVRTAHTSYICGTSSVALTDLRRRDHWNATQLWLQWVRRHSLADPHFRRNDAAASSVSASSLSAANLAKALDRFVVRHQIVDPHDQRIVGSKEYAATLRELAARRKDRINHLDSIEKSTHTPKTKRSGKQAGKRKAAAAATKEATQPTAAAAQQCKKQRTDDDAVVHLAGSAAASSSSAAAPAASSSSAASLPPSSAVLNFRSIGLACSLRFVSMWDLEVCQRVSHSWRAAAASALAWRDRAEVLRFHPAPLGKILPAVELLEDERQAHEIVHDSWPGRRATGIKLASIYSGLARNVSRLDCVSVIPDTRLSLLDFIHQQLPNLSSVRMRVDLSAEHAPTFFAHPLWARLRKIDLDFTSPLPIELLISLIRQRLSSAREFSWSVAENQSAALADCMPHAESLSLRNLHATHPLLFDPMLSLHTLHLQPLTLDRLEDISSTAGKLFPMLSTLRIGLEAETQLQGDGQRRNAASTLFHDAPTSHLLWLRRLSCLHQIRSLRHLEIVCNSHHCPDSMLPLRQAQHTFGAEAFKHLESFTIKRMDIRPCAVEPHEAGDGLEPDEPPAAAAAAGSPLPLSRFCFPSLTAVHLDCCDPRMFDGSDSRDLARLCAQLPNVRRMSLTPHAAEAGMSETALDFLRHAGWRTLSALESLRIDRMYFGTELVSVRSLQALASLSECPRLSRVEIVRVCVLANRSEVCGVLQAQDEEE